MAAMETGDEEVEDTMDASEYSDVVIVCVDFPAEDHYYAKVRLPMWAIDSIVRRGGTKAGGLIHESEPNPKPMLLIRVGHYAPATLRVLYLLRNYFPDHGPLTLEDASLFIRSIAQVPHSVRPDDDIEVTTLHTVTYAPVNMLTYVLVGILLDIPHLVHAAQLHILQSFSSVRETEKQKLSENMAVALTNFESYDEVTHDLLSVDPSEGASRAMQGDIGETDGSGPENRATQLIVYELFKGLGGYEPDELVNMDPAKYTYKDGMGDQASPEAEQPIPDDWDVQYQEDEEARARDAAPAPVDVGQTLTELIARKCINRVLISMATADTTRTANPFILGLIDVAKKSTDIVISNMAINISAASSLRTAATSLLGGTVPDWLPTQGTDVCRSALVMIGLEAEIASDGTPDEATLMQMRKLFKSQPRNRRWKSNLALALGDALSLGYTLREEVGLNDYAIRGMGGFTVDSFRVLALSAAAEPGDADTPRRLGLVGRKYCCGIIGACVANASTASIWAMLSELNDTSLGKQWNPGVAPASYILMAALSQRASNYSQDESATQIVQAVQLAAKYTMPPSVVLVHWRNLRDGITAFREEVSRTYNLPDLVITGVASTANGSAAAHRMRPVSDLGIGGWGKCPLLIPYVQRTSKHALKAANGFAWSDSMAEKDREASGRMVTVGSISSLEQKVTSEHEVHRCHGGSSASKSTDIPGPAIAHGLSDDMNNANISEKYFFGTTTPRGKQENYGAHSPVPVDIDTRYPPVMSAADLVGIHKEMGLPMQINLFAILYDKNATPKDGTRSKLREITNHYFTVHSNEIKFKDELKNQLIEFADTISGKEQFSRRGGAGKEEAEEEEMDN
jgi:hypothetical protein